MRRRQQIKAAASRFIADESGAAAVDWVVVLAAASSLGAGAVASVGVGATDLGREAAPTERVAGVCAGPQGDLTCIRAARPAR
jgi:Flp pilus assembly pilin Flp